jgi:hypothetical protein
MHRALGELEKDLIYQHCLHCDLVLKEATCIFDPNRAAECEALIEKERKKQLKKPHKFTPSANAVHLL